LKYLSWILHCPAGVACPNIVPQTHPHPQAQAQAQGHTRTLRERKVGT